MRSLAMVRKVDELGRIVLPKELRDMMDLSPKDGVEIFADGNSRIILQKYLPACVFCGEANDVIVYNEKKICKKCLREIVALAK